MSELDREALDKLRRLEAQGTPGLVDDVVRMFLTQLDEKLQKLPVSVARGDSRAVEADAHALRGSASQLGALRIAAVCEELEQLAARKDLSGAAQRVEELKEAAGRARLELGQAGGT